MCARKFRLPSLVFTTIVLAASPAWAMGFGLGETKEQLKLKYDVSVKDHGTGRVTVVLTITDQGRLKPLDSVDLVVPATEKNKHGGSYVDLWAALATREEGGRQVVRVHLLRELAERAEIHLKTSTLDGKKDLLTWYYHRIPIADYLKEGEQEKGGQAKPKSYMRFPLPAAPLPARPLPEQGKDAKADAPDTKTLDLPLPKLGEDFRPEEAHYWSDFEKAEAAGEEWSRRETLALPGLDTTVLGKFANEPVTLSLKDLPKHRFVRIYFDLYTLQSWDGDAADAGPDLWLARIADGPQLVYASFATGHDRKQSYPLPFGLLSAPGLAGGRRVRSRLPWYGTRTWSSHAVYPMCFTVPHTEETLRLHFTGIGLLNITDESWGLDNVGVALLQEHPTKKLTAEELDKAWQALGSEDVAAVHGAIQSLVASGDQGADYLIGKMGWTFDRNYKDHVMGLAHVLALDEPSQWEEAAHEFRGGEPRAWPLVFSLVDKRRFGENPPPWFDKFFDRWNVKEGPPEFLRHARVARVLELIWTEKSRRALLFE